MKLSLTIAGEALAMQGNELYINCGDNQPITVAQLRFADQQTAQQLYCKPLKIRLEIEECDAEEAARLYRLNAAASDLLKAVKHVRETLAHVTIESDHYRLSVDDMAFLGNVIRSAVAKAEVQS